MKGKMYLWREDVLVKGKICFCRGRWRCIYEGEDESTKEKKIRRIFKRSENTMLFQKPKKFREFLIAKINKFPKISRKKEAHVNVWESILEKSFGIFGLFATAHFYTWKRNFYKKKRNFMGNGWRRPPAGEHTFMKANVFMKGNMYLWRWRCIQEGDDAFIKRKCIYEGKDIFIQRKIYL